jgi:hypothetical protein
MRAGAVMMARRRAHPLLLAAGELVRGTFQHPLQPQQPGGVPDPAVDLPGGRAQDGEGQGDVLKGGEGVQQVAVLEDEAQPLPAEAREGLAPQGGDVGAVHGDGAGRGTVDGGHTVQKGGLARAGRAHNAHELAGEHVEAEVVQGPGVAAPVTVDLLQM